MPTFSPLSQQGYTHGQRVHVPPAKSLALSWSQLHCSCSQSNPLTERAGAEIKTGNGPQWGKVQYWTDQMKVRSLRLCRSSAYFRNVPGGDLQGSQANSIPLASQEKRCCPRPRLTISNCSTGLTSAW
jgi:hypothetical protein